MKNLNPLLEIKKAIEISGEGLRKIASKIQRDPHWTDAKILKIFGKKGREAARKLQQQA